MTETTNEERIVMIGYIMGLLAREANQKGDVEVSTSNIQKLLELFGLDPELSSNEESLIEFTEGMTLKVNLEQNSNRKQRRWKLKKNKNEYKLQ